MLRYKTETRPGLVTLYDIRPGNGAGPFLQPRSPHGASNDRESNGQCDTSVCTDRAADDGMSCDLQVLTAFITYWRTNW